MWLHPTANVDTSGLNTLSFSPHGRCGKMWWQSSKEGYLILPHRDTLTSAEILTNRLYSLWKKARIVSYCKKNNCLLYVYLFFASLEINFFSLCLSRGERGLMDSCEKHQQSQGYMFLEALHSERKRKKKKRVSDNPCSLIHAGASSPQLLGESVEANGIRAGASVPCGRETVVAGAVTINHQFKEIHNA